jgi:hypothetical protein
MGLEAECTVRVGRKTSAGKAQLEGEVLGFRGDFRLEIPFDDIKSVKAEGAELVVRTADQEARFEVGAHVAERWARLITEPKGLFEKLEVGPESRVAVVDVTDSLFVTALRERTAQVAEGRVPEGAPTIFFGAESRDALRKIQLLRARMIDSGAIWILRPKGSQAISEADVFDAVRTAGLVDTKVVSFSKTHTAHKCVIPLELRGKPAPPRPPILSIPPSAPRLAELKKAAAKSAAAKAKATKANAENAAKAAKAALAEAAKAATPARTVKPVKPAKPAKASGAAKAKPPKKVAKKAAKKAAPKGKRR